MKSPQKTSRSHRPRGLQNAVIGFIVFIALIALFSSFYAPAKDTTTVGLNDLANDIRAGNVSSITVSGDTITTTLKDKSVTKTKKEADASLSQTLSNYGITPVMLSSIPLQVKDPSGFEYWATLLLPTLLPLIIIGLFLWLMFRQARSGASQALSFGKSNIRLFSSFKDQVMFNDVAGLQEAKQELTEVVDFLKHPKKYLDIGATIPRGVLLLGPPGTGKTLLARATAGEAGVPFFHISASEFVEMFVGVGASRTRDAFATAKKAAPAILFIDEIDAIGRERGAGLGGGHDEREQTLNQILVEMDGFDRESRVIVLAATNRPDILDSALMRPGRFDRRITLDLPDINDREAILNIHSRNKKLSGKLDLRQVAIRTPGFSGADLANLINEAALLAARNNKKTISQANLYEAIEKVMLGPERRSRVLSKHEKDITAYHEAGHALVAAALKHADPVHKISIIARGRAGGYTIKLPLEEMHLKTKKQFLADLAVAFGGYVAEQQTFGDVSTGAANDIAVASEIARSLVTRYGMSDAFGPIAFGKTQEMIFLGREISQEKNYSETVAAKIDKEIQSIVDKTLKSARHIIKKYKKGLEKIAHTLIKKETIEKEEFDSIIRSLKIKTVEI